MAMAMTTTPRRDGEVALITGAGSADGIGMAVARQLAADGSAVVVTSTTDRIHERAEELRALGGAVTSVVIDLMDAGAADRLVATALDLAGRLDVCVNNAGMVAVGGAMVDAPAVATTDAMWRDGLDRNLTTCFAVMRAVLPVMTNQRYGRIVNVASTSGPVQAFVGDPAYHAAKAGMIGLTRAVALEVAAHGVTVNAVAPGWIATASQTSSESVAGDLTPVGRSGSPEEVAAVAAFLVSRQASYITGQLIVIDGGNSLVEDRAWRP
jgi:3-oxoacyl-[acyl-carrier protein] reductase